MEQIRYEEQKAFASRQKGIELKKSMQSIRHLHRQLNKKREVSMLSAMQNRVQRIFLWTNQFFLDLFFLLLRHESFGLDTSLLS